MVSLNLRWSIVTVAFALLLSNIIVLAGSLDPPAAPAGTMVTLEEIQAGVSSAEDARTAIATLPITISSPGSYYLRGDLIATSGDPGITIAADNVDIDLNGFSLIGDAVGTTGVLGEAVTPEHTGITIRNGTIRDWTEDGVNLELCLGAALRDLRLIDNQRDGAALGESAQVTDCFIMGSGENGLQAFAGCILSNTSVIRSINTGAGVSGESVITNCIFRENGLGSDGEGAGAGGGGLILGANSVLERSSICGNRGDMISFIYGFGVLALGDVVIRECVIQDNETFGIAAGGRITDNLVEGNGSLAGITAGNAVISGNVCRNNTGQGIHAVNSIITGNTCTGSSTQGIHSGGRCRIENNLCTYNDVGIDATTGDNLVVRNVCLSNPGGDYAAGDGTALPVNPGTNFTDGLIPHPWANFEN